MGDALPQNAADAMDATMICDRIQPHFDRHVPGDNIEVEFRFGRFNGTYFDTNVGKEVFDKITCGLHQYTGWERVDVSECDVYYDDDTHTRITVDSETGDKTVIQKHTRAQEDFTQFDRSPLDLRFTISCETPTQPAKISMDRRRTKHRVSYVRKNLSIDTTITRGDPVDKDSEEDVSYQIEFEIVDPSDVGCVEELFNIVYKVNDVLKILK